MSRRPPSPATGCFLVLLLAACRPAPGPGPTALPSSTPPVTSTPPPTPSPLPPPTATPSPMLAPAELTVCLADEPASLYLYARPEPGRDHLLAALYDGPIDAHDYAFAPVLMEALPSPDNGGLRVQTVPVEAGAEVVDARGRLQPLQPGLELLRADGSLFTYSGSGPADLPQMQVTFHLRPGLRWSDGAPLTAADSVFSFEVAGSPDSFDPQAAARERLASYQALDDTTVAWTGKPGYLDALYYTRFWTPLPRHVFEGLSPAAIADSDAARRSPLGWGPFVLDQWVTGTQIVFTRNPLYWRAPEGLPRLERVVYRFAGDEAGLAAAIRAGGCDVVPSGPALDQAALSAAGLTLYRAPGETLVHLDFNLRPAVDARPALAALQDIRVRQAVAYCLDRPALNPAGPEAAPTSYLPAGHPLLAGGLNAYPHDPARATALLAEAGWNDSDGDGVMDRDGQPLALTLAGDTPEPVLAGLQMQLGGCGIDVALRSLTRGELAGDWPDGLIFGRRFDLAVFGWRIGALPPCAAYTSEQTASDQNPGGANAAGYSDTGFDQACRRALTTLDPGEAARAHAQAQQILARDLPTLPLYFTTRTGAAGAGVQGYALDGSSESELWSLEALSWRP